MWSGTAAKKAFVAAQVVLGALLIIVVLWAVIVSAATTITETSSVTGGLSVLGALSKGSGTFVIDHPLDPKNKLLYHSFVESPDVKNIYDGVVELNSRGEATIELPRYFFVLNRDFRYLATPSEIAMPNLYLAREVRPSLFGLGKPTFTIAGGKPGGTVFWQVTGIRKDPFILANPIINEVEKGAETLVDRGVCLFEPLCN